MSTYPCVSQKEPPKLPWWFLLAVLGMALLMCLIFSQVKAEEVNLDIIAQIESNNNPMAYNAKSQARGLYQITPICLKEYNNAHPNSRKSKQALFSPVEARTVAKWYMAIRIPQLLRAYKLQDTVNNRLIAYNAGIGKLSKGIIPQESRNYVRKYHKILQSHGKQRIS